MFSSLFVVPPINGCTFSIRLYCLCHELALAVVKPCKSLTINLSCDTPSLHLVQSIDINIDIEGQQCNTNLADSSQTPPLHACFSLLALTVGITY